MGIYRGAQQGGISFTLQEGLQDKDIQGKSATMKCSFTLQKDRLFNDRDVFFLLYRLYNFFLADLVADEFGGDIGDLRGAVVGVESKIGAGTFH